MKKFRIISVILAVTMLLCILPITGVSAATKELKALSAVTLPDNLCDNSAEDYLDGTILKLSYTDGTSTTITLSSDNTYCISSFDYSEELGLFYSIFFIAADSDNYITAEAQAFISDFAEINFYLDDYENPVEAKYTYPDTFELPNSFVKDMYSYTQNDDGTLTLNTYLGEIKTGDYLEIPETVCGKTVTAVNDYAFAITEPPASVTVPETVTSIGQYAFGYYFSYYDEVSYDLPENIVDSELCELLVNAEDTDEFKIDINLYGIDYDEQVEYLINTYFNGTTNYEYDSYIGYITITATKLQILSMADETEIEISLAYEGSEGSIDRELYEFISDMPADKKVDIIIYLYSDSYFPNYNRLAASVMTKYFNGSSDYECNTQMGYLTTSATAEQVLSMKDDEDLYVELNVPYALTTELYQKLFYMEDNDTCSIIIESFSDDNQEDVLNKLANEYFNSNDCEIHTIIDTSILIVNNAKKSQITALSDNEDILVDYLEEYPFVRIDDFTLYGYNGSAAQQYAKNCAIKFVDLGGVYQLGDVNLDGTINVQDATEIQKYRAGLVDFNDSQLAVADFDKNGEINILDATEVQKYLAGLVTID